MEENRANNPKNLRQVPMMPLIAHESEVNSLMRIIKWLIIGWVITIILFVSLLVPQTESRGEVNAPITAQSQSKGSGNQNS